MKVWAISDLHLDTTTDKPMDRFGDEWIGYKEKFQEDWKTNVAEEDLVLLGGDISWAINIEEAKPDYEILRKLPGTKIVVKGNHDLYWSSLTKIQQAIPDFIFLQYNSVKIGQYIICGTRGWTYPVEGSETYEQDKKLYTREMNRLKMSLDAMMKLRQDGDIVIGMVHFPPFNAQYEDSDTSKMFAEYKVDKVIYGHLHGNQVRSEKVVYKDGIPYYLTSADLVDFKMTRLY